MPNTKVEALKKLSSMTYLVRGLYDIPHPRCFETSKVLRVIKIQRFRSYCHTLSFSMYDFILISKPDIPVCGVKSQVCVTKWSHTTPILINLFAATCFGCNC